MPAYLSASGSRTHHRPPLGWYTGIPSPQQTQLPPLLGFWSCSSLASHSPFFIITLLSSLTFFARAKPPIQYSLYFLPDLQFCEHLCDYLVTKCPHWTVCSMRVRDCVNFSLLYVECFVSAWLIINPSDTLIS